MTSNFVSASSLLTYADPQASKLERVVVRGLENALGRRALVKQLMDLMGQPSDDVSFWSWAAEKLKFSYVINQGDLSLLPDEGPVVVLANHPFGVADGLIMADILHQRYGDFRLMVHETLCKLPQTHPYLVPIRFDDNPETMRENLNQCRNLTNFCKAGGSVGLFPAGVVSTANSPFGQAVDPSWKTFAAKLITKSNAKVVPMYFEGQNSRLFQIASQYSHTIRKALFIREAKNMAAETVGIRIGEPFSAEVLKKFDDRSQAANFLRDSVYALGGRADVPEYKSRIF